MWIRTQDRCFLLNCNWVGFDNTGEPDPLVRINGDLDNNIGTGLCFLGEYPRGRAMEILDEIQDCIVSGKQFYQMPAE